MSKKGSLHTLEAWSSSLAAREICLRKGFMFNCSGTCVLRVMQAPTLHQHQNVFYILVWFLSHALMPHQCSNVRAFGVLSDCSWDDKFAKCGVGNSCTGEWPWQGAGDQIALPNLDSEFFPWKERWKWLRWHMPQWTAMPWKRLLDVKENFGNCTIDQDQFVSRIRLKKV